LAAFAAFLVGLRPAFPAVFLVALRAAGFGAAFFLAFFAALLFVGRAGFLRAMAKSSGDS
jgi:hypothetical protein